MRNTTKDAIAGTKLNGRKNRVSPRKAHKIQQATGSKWDGKQATGRKPDSKLMKGLKARLEANGLQATEVRPEIRVYPLPSPQPAALATNSQLTMDPQSVTIIQPIEGARWAKARRNLGGMDYVRYVLAAVETSDQSTVARALGVSQPSISRLVKQAEAKGVKPVPEGFSGASPYEIAERYAAGDIDRAAMIRQLSVWPYTENGGAAAAAAEWESTPYMDTPGSFAEVGQAFDEGLIDGDAYDEILDASDEAPGL